MKIPTSIFAVLTLTTLTINLQSASALTCTSLNQNLSNGASGTEVKKLQQFLYENGYMPTIPKANKYGPATVSAVKKFQSDNKLVVTGTIGKASREKVKSISCGDSVTAQDKKKYTFTADQLAKLKVDLTQIFVQTKADKILSEVQKAKLEREVEAIFLRDLGVEDIMTKNKDVQNYPEIIKIINQIEKEYNSTSRPTTTVATPKLLTLVGDNITQIETGTSFGMCLGYCQNQYIINSKSIIHNSSSWSTTSPNIKKEISFTAEEWNSLIATLDIKKFNTLPDRFGCPDCADGGAEWISISDGKNTKKVVFDYGSDIPEISIFIKSLRQLTKDTTARIYKDSLSSAWSKFTNSASVPSGSRVILTSVGDIVNDSKSQKCVFDYKNNDEHKKLTVYASGGVGQMVRDYYDKNNIDSIRDSAQQYINDNDVLVVYSATSGVKYIRKDLESMQDKAAVSIVKSNQYNTPAFSLNERLQFVCEDWVKDINTLTPSKDIIFK